MKSDADIMADAREYIEKNGWWRGSLVGPNHRQVCGMGGVAASQDWLTFDNNLAVRVDKDHYPRVADILTKVMLAIGHREMDFIVWNDEYAKGKQEVLDAFAKAEKIERAGFDPDA